METQKPFDQMNATEKTKFLGFRSYSQRETKERERMFKEKASELTVFFLKTLLEKEDVKISRDLSDEEKQKNYSDAVNKTYEYALQGNFSLYDLEGVARTIQDLSVFAERMANYAQGEYYKLSYALTGENKFEYVSMKKLMDITKVASDVFPKPSILEDDEVTEPAKEDVIPEEPKDNLV